MVVMAGVLIVAGLLNGANVLDSEESWRLIMYHWAFPLAFFTALSLSLAIAAVIGRSLRNAPAARRSWVCVAVAGVALAAIAVPSAVNPALDRETNTLAAAHAPIERRYVDELVDQALAQRDRLDGGPLLVVSQHAAAFSSVRASVTLYLVEEGVDARLPRAARWYAPDRRLAGRDTVEAGLLLVEDYDPDPSDITVGRLIADVNTIDELDLAAYEALRDQFDGVDELRFGSDVVAQLDELPESWIRAAESGDLDRIGSTLNQTLEGSAATRVVEQIQILLRLYALRNEPSLYLLDRDLLEFVAAHPLAEPALDPDHIERLLRTGPDQLRADRPMRLRVFLLDSNELQTVHDRAEV
jgi:hypothetical protein